MAFDNIVFPLIVETVTSSPEFNTTIIPTSSGAEQRNVNWADAKITFNAALGVRSKIDIQTLVNFFRARKGRARGFLVRDLLDCTADSTRDILGVGTAASGETTFQLQRIYSDVVQNATYGITGNADIRPIYKPIRGTVQVYKSGTPSPLVEGGYGAFATATITGGSSGVVGGITMTTQGSGYTSVPTVSFSGGGGTGVAGTAVLSPKQVTTINVTAGGSGYTSAPLVTISGGGGAGATATATVSVGGVVTAIVITAPGTGYTSTPTVAIAGGGGTGATATAVVSSYVTGVTITNGGSAYTSAPTVSFSGGSGSGAAAVAVVGTGYVSGITINNGGANYTTPPVVIISGGGGSGATASTSLTGNAVTGITSLVGGSGYTTPPTVTIINVDGGYSIDYRTGKLYLTTDLPNGIVLSWSGEFYVPCRFVEDKLPADEVFFDVFLRNSFDVEIPRHTAPGAGNIPDILMQETRDFI